MSSSDLQVYKDRFQNICSHKVEAPGMVIMRDVAIAKSEYQADERAVTKIQDFQHDEVLSQYFYSPAIIPYVSSIIGEDIMAMHTMLINKPPDPGELRTIKLMRCQIINNTVGVGYTSLRMSVIKVTGYPLIKFVGANF